MAEEKITWRDIVKGEGDLFTIRSFQECVKFTYFTNDDGTGRYASKTQVSNVQCIPSEVRENGANKRFTHVLWYNK